MKYAMTFLVAAALLLPCYAHAEPLGAGQWDETTIELFSEIPVQDGGRIKPFQTYANFTLLPLNSKRSFDAPTGQEMDAVSWLLDLLFLPEETKDYKHFVVDNTDVLANIGVITEEVRSRFSYNELAPGRDRLFELAQEYSQLAADQRTPTEQMTLNLAQNLQRYEFLIHYFDFARAEHTTGGSQTLARLFPQGEGPLTMSGVLARGDDISAALQDLQTTTGGNSELMNRELMGFAQLFDELDLAIALALFPPTNAERAEWYTPSDLLTESLDTEVAPLSKEIEMLAALEGMATKVGDPLAFKQELRTYHDLVVAQATARSEYNKIPLEVSFYNAQYFSRALAFFVFSFVLVALSWLAVGNKWLNRATWASVIVPLILLTIGITLRCIIQGRPPVTTLYETILFITAVSVLVALFIEYVNRQRIAIAIASFLGCAGMFVANRYELGDGQDTMPSLVAVLDTNFWLATHVTIVVIGYAAGMLAAAVSHIYILGKLFNLKSGDKAFYRTVTRMVYGIICFGLLFSFIGTVLGGIWANYSWGRFWGWDPKENGAMMIVLCNLAILHARMGGYIKDLGIHVGSVFAGCVVMFSHFGVNQLGVGLHSYGFTDGIWGNLILFWSVQTGVILLAIPVKILETRRKRGTSAAPPSDAASGFAK